MATIGLNYVFKIIPIDDVKIKLQIWDTAGQDKFKTITKNYYRNSQGVLVVFGVDCRDSFYSVCTYSLIKKGGWKISQTPPMKKHASCSSATKKTFKTTGRSPNNRASNSPINMESNTSNVALKLPKTLTIFFKKYAKR